MKVKELLKVMDLDTYLIIDNGVECDRIELNADNSFIRLLGDLEVENIFSEHLIINVKGVFGDD